MARIRWVSRECTIINLNTTTCTDTTTTINWNYRNLSSPAAEICYQLKEDLKRRHRAIFEGVPRAGHCKPFDQIYVEPQISTCRYGGVDPSHEFRSPSCPQVLAPDSFISLNNLFRLQKSDGSAVRTVLTSGIPGMGMTVSVCKFCLDWAEMRANKVTSFYKNINTHSIIYIFLITATLFNIASKCTFVIW